MSQFAAQGSAGMLQQAQMGQTQGNTTATATIANPLTYTSNTQWPPITPPYYTSSPQAKVTDVSPPPTAEVPIIDKSDKAGLFLRDEAGNLVHVETSKLFKAFLEW